jgi:hypothetical protein
VKQKHKIAKLQNMEDVNIDSCRSLLSAWSIKFVILWQLL